MAVLMLCTLAESRRAFQEGNEGFRRRLASLSGEGIPAVPHADTTNNSLARLGDLGELERRRRRGGVVYLALPLQPLFPPPQPEEPRHDPASHRRLSR
ncbi:MAG: hypothetical protein WC789_05690 [Lentisphaeria bacterium]|jgi:hypothetical protein